MSVSDPVRIVDEDGHPIDLTNPLPTSATLVAGGNVDANLQVGNVDVADTNPVPVNSQGESFDLLVSAAHGAAVDALGAAVDILKRIAFGIVLEFTNKATDVTDTCDVFIDMNVDGTWVNAVHFTQVLGNAADASKQYAQLMLGVAYTTIDVTANAVSGEIRPNVMGSQMRARWTIVDPGAGAASFTFSLKVFAQ